MADDQLLERFVRSFPRGTVLFREGEPGGEMYVLRVGKITISRRVGQVERIISTLGQGEFFGEMSILTGRPRTATAAVTEDARILCLDARTFEAMVRSNAEIATRMVKKLAERLAWANDHITTLLLRDAPSRVVHWLVAAAGKGGEPDGPVDLPISPDELPAQVGVTPVAVRDIVARLHRARFLSASGSGILIADAGRLRQLLEFLETKAPAGDPG